MFNNCDSKTNGEYTFYTNIRKYIKVIFDVGTKRDSLFTDFEGEVHYFEPVKEHLENLSIQPTNNSKSFYNNFGLSDENKDSYYYPKYESFFDRIESCKESDDKNKIVLKLNRGDIYMLNKNITTIDFLKIDTEGYELKVIKGFGEYIKNIKIIQFEYGGTFLDNNTKLIDVINYLEKYGFHKFAYLTNSGPVLASDFKDHYQYCNIICYNKTLLP
jgi:FkbM family methyltransferase